MSVKNDESSTSVKKQIYGHSYYLRTPVLHILKWFTNILYFNLERSPLAKRTGHSRENDHAVQLLQKCSVVFLGINREMWSFPSGINAIS